MNKITKISILTLASALFTGTLLSATPMSVHAEDDFVVDFHYIDFLKVEVGDNFTVALSTTNEVYTFGRNNFGQLGIGDSNILEKNVPTNITSSFNLIGSEKIKDIAAGSGHVVALSTTNRIFTWGFNSDGQLGNQNTINQFAPAVRTNLNPTSLTVSKIVASQANTLVLFSNHTIRIAGSNESGMLLNGNTTPSTNVSTPDITAFRSTATVVDIGASYKTGYILLSDGKIGLWGFNGFGQLGNGTQVSSSTLTSITSANLSLTGGEKVISVATGKNHTVALTSNQKVFFWGTNSNFAVGTAVAENNLRTTPFNITSWFTTPQINNGYVYFGFNDSFAEYGSRPVNVYAGNDSTVFKLIEIRREYIDQNTMGPIVEFPENSWYEALGLNNNNGSGFILSDDRDLVLVEPDYISYEYWDDENSSAISISFSETNVAIINAENDYTIHGSNLYGQMGLGYTTQDEDDISNYSSNFRYFEEYVYPDLPTNFNAPLDPYFDDLSIPQRADEYDALFDYGLFYYYFDSFNEKEFSLLTPTQLTTIHTIFAEIFEDQVLYGWVPATNAELLTYVQDNLDDRYWLREDMEAMANYQSWMFAEWANLDDVILIEQDVIDLLDPEVETRLDEFRTLLDRIQTFEDDVLQPFVQLLSTLNTNDYEYTEFYNNGLWLSLGNSDIERLIGLGYTDDILAIFDAYNALTELEQLLLMERHESNYFELYEDYYRYFVDQYSDLLTDFEVDIQDGDWGWYWPLYENLSELEALLAGIEDLNDISYELFVEMYGQENEFFEYDMYEYWIWLSELQPLIQEGKNVFDQIVLIEDLIQDEGDGEFVNVEDAADIIAMYNDFLALSLDAKDKLDPEYVEWIYGLAMEALADQVADQLWDLSDIEDEDGTYGLFANYDDVLAAIEAYEALPEEAKDILERRQDEADYYEYLVSIQEALEEGMDVYDQIILIEDLIQDEGDGEFVNVEDAADIIAMYNDFLALSEDAQDLLDPEYVEWIYGLAMEALADQVADQLWDLSDIEDEDGTYGLFANYDDVLAAIEAYEALPEEAKDILERRQDEADYYEYLVSIQEALEEGMDVYEDILAIEAMDLDNLSGETIEAILAMYAEYSALTEDAQDLLDPEYVESLYQLAIEALAEQVVGQLLDLSDIEDEDGTYGLFANYDDVLAAIEAYEALLDDAQALLSEDDVAYYEYLVSIQEALAEGMDVYEDILAIEAMDLDNLSSETIESISDMYAAYSALTEDAQDLLDPEYVDYLVGLVVESVEGSIDNLPPSIEDFESLFNNEETKEASINELLDIWEQYQSMSEELKAQMDPDSRARLEALHARYLELLEPTVDLSMIGLILVHLSAGVYFSFKKRDVLVKPVQ